MRIGGTGAAASSAADRAAAAQATAAAIVADVERRLQASGMAGPEGGVKALALPPQVCCHLQHTCMAACHVATCVLISNSA